MKIFVLEAVKYVSKADVQGSNSIGIWFTNKVKVTNLVIVDQVPVTKVKVKLLQRRHQVQFKMLRSPKIKIYL